MCVEVTRTTMACMCFCVKASGAETVIIIGRNSSAERLKLALELDADYN
ncbi:hypothetical protein ACIQXV_23300 [Neobacillus sp. NPDC097160]